MLLPLSYSCYHSVLASLGAVIIVPAQISVMQICNRLRASVVYLVVPSDYFSIERTGLMPVGSFQSLREVVSISDSHALCQSRYQFELLGSRGSQATDSAEIGRCPRPHPSLPVGTGMLAHLVVRRCLAFMWPSRNTDRICQPPNNSNWYVDSIRI